MFFYLDVKFKCIFGANNHIVSEISQYTLKIKISFPNPQARALYGDAQIYLLHYSVLTCCGGGGGRGRVK